MLRIISGTNGSTSYKTQRIFPSSILAYLSFHYKSKHFHIPKIFIRRWLPIFSNKTQSLTSINAFLWVFLSMVFYQQIPVHPNPLPPSTPFTSKVWGKTVCSLCCCCCYLQTISPHFSLKKTSDSWFSFPYTIPPFVHCPSCGDMRHWFPDYSSS